MSRTVIMTSLKAHLLILDPSEAVPSWAAIDNGMVNMQARAEEPLQMARTVIRVLPFRIPNAFQVPL